MSDDDGQAKYAAKPRVAWRREPNGDCAVGADVEVVIRIDGVKPAPHVFQAGAEAGEGVGLKIDVAELDHAGTRRLNQTTALPFDAGITDRAFGVVPDRSFGSLASSDLWCTITHISKLFRK